MKRSQEVRELCALSAFSLFWAWVFLKDWSTILLEDNNALLLAKGCSFVGVAVGFTALKLIGKRASSIPHKTTIGMILCALCGAGVAFHIVANPPLGVAIFVLWFLSGLGESMLLCRIVKTLATFGKRRGFALGLCVAVMASCALATYASMMPKESLAAAFLCIALPVLSGLFLRWHQLQAEGDGETPFVDTPANTANPKRRTAQDVLNSLGMFVFSAAFAFGLIVNLHTGLSTNLELIWVGGFAVGIAGLFFVTMVENRHRFLFARLVVIAIAIVCSVMLSSSVWSNSLIASICCIVLMFGFTGHDMLCFMHFITAEPVWKRFVFDRWLNALGIAIGWGLASASLFCAHRFGNIPFVQSISIVLAAFLLVLILGFAYLALSGRIVNEKKPAESADLASSEQMDAHPNPSPSRDLWKESCDFIGSAHGLSSREIEVLSLYARGLDSTFISKELCISSHTVKSHIQHIYAKTGLHSQNELISLTMEHLLEIR